MANKYEWEINPFQDFLFKSIMLNVDISSKKYENNIYSGLITILSYIVDKEDLVFLEYELKNKNGYFKLIAKNIVTALWFSLVFPENPKNIMLHNEVIIDNIKYKFNYRTNKLTYKEL